MVLFGALTFHPWNVSAPISCGERDIEAARSPTRSER